MDIQKDFFRWLAEKAVNYKRFFIIFWIILAILAIIPAMRVDTVLQGEGASVKGSESFIQNELIKTNFPQQSAFNIIVTLKSETLTVDSIEFQNTIKRIKTFFISKNRAGDIYDYTLDSSMISKDRKSTYIIIGLKDFFTNAEAGEYSSELVSLLKTIPIDKNIKLNTVSDSLMVREMTKLSGDDSAKTEKRVLPLVIITLVIVFGALVSAFVPVLMAFVSIILTLAFIYFIGQHFELAIFSKAITTMMGLGVGIDYSLFMISRFREELLKGYSKRKAAIETSAIAGKAICYSGFAVSIGMLVMLIPDLPLTRSIGFSGFIVVMISVLITLTLLPGILSILGDRINSPRRISKKIFQKINVPAITNNLWFNWSSFVMKKPIIFLSAGLVLLLFISSFAFSIKLWNSSILLMPNRLESKAGYKDLIEIDPSRKFSPISITFETKDGSNIYEKNNISEIYSFINKIENLYPIQRAFGIVDSNSDMTLEDYQTLYANTMVLQSLKMAQQNPFVNTDSNRALIIALHKDDKNKLADWDTVVNLRNFRDDNFKNSNIQILIGGGGSINVDFKKAVYEYFPMIISLIIGATFIIMLLLFGSVILPIKAILMNILSVTVSYGLLVLVFQFGFAVHIFGLEKPPGGLLIITPLVLFCIIFGLSMDYEIFIMSRIKEEFDKFGNVPYSIAMGLEKSGGIVTSAALIMVVIFGAFAFSDVVLVQEVGLGLAAAVFIDATVIRIMLVPSVLKIMGKFVWWIPKKMKDKLIPVKLEH